MGKKLKSLNYKFCEDSLIFHDHPLADKKSDDKDYQRVYSNKYYVHDMQLYRKRRASNWKFIKPNEDNINKPA